MSHKTMYEIRKIDVCYDRFWYWVDSTPIGDFETASQNVNLPFMKALKKLGITFQKGSVYIECVRDIDGDILEVRNRETGVPYFVAIPVEMLD